jgi:phosphoserine phosphatase
MGQAVTHGLLSLSFVLELNSDTHGNSGAVLKDLLFEANKMGLSLSYKVVDEILKHEEIQDEKFVVTCVAPKTITSKFRTRLTTWKALN